MSRLSRFWYSLRGAPLERDLRDEMEFHIEMRARELKAAGVPEREARARARRQFGNVGAIEDRTREVDHMPSLDALLRDLRYSLRSLRKSPTFTAVSVATIALGIGANLAVFGMVNAVLFRPLPYPDSKGLMLLGTRDRNGDFDYASYADLPEWQAQSRTIEGMAAYVPQSVNLTGEQQPERLKGAFVSPEFFELLGAKALRGRLLQPADNQPGSPGVAIVTYALWQSRYGGAEDFVGRKVVINGVPLTVAGILSPDFRFPWSDTDIWLPYIYSPNYQPGDRGNLNSAIFGRLRPGRSVEKANAEMAAISARLAAAYPATNRDRTAMAIPFRDFLSRDVRGGMLLLWGAVGVVFVIACANLANLAMARMLAREHEMRVRIALGAGPFGLVSQLLMENAMVAAVGFALAVVLGGAALGWLQRDSIGLFVFETQLRLDAATLGYGAVLALTATLFGSALAAAQSLRPRRSAVPEGTRGLTQTRGRGAARRALVVAELALSIVLLAGAGLLLKSYTRLSSVDPGFRTANLLTAEYRLPRNKYATAEQQWAAHWKVVEALRRIPGVRSASAILALPFSGNGGQSIVVLPDRPAPPRGSEPRVITNRIAPGALETLGVPLEQGRNIDERDHAKAAPVAVISRSFARRFWPDQDPIGRSVVLPEARNTALTVVGVVGDIRQWQLDEPLRPQLYVPFAQMPHIFSTVVIETAGPPSAFAGALRQAVWSVDKDQPVWKVRTMESLTSGFLNGRAFLPRVLAGFAAFALLLAAVGIYGVIAYSTARRIREFGLRMAIGAQPRDVVWLVLRDGLRMTLAGTAIGGVSAFGLSRLLKQQLQGQLFRVESTDPATFTAVVALLAAVSLLACYIPVRRALRVDPVSALRHE